MAKQYFLDCQALNLMFSDPAVGIFLRTEQYKIQGLLGMSSDMCFIILGTVIDLGGLQLRFLSKSQKERFIFFIIQS